MLDATYLTSTFGEVIPICFQLPQIIIPQFMKIPNLKFFSFYLL